MESLQRTDNCRAKFQTGSLELTRLIIYRLGTLIMNLFKMEIFCTFLKVLRPGNILLCVFVCALIKPVLILREQQNPTSLKLKGQGSDNVYQCSHTLVRTEGRQRPH